MEKYSSGDSTSYILGISLTIEAIRQIPERMEKVYLSKRAIRNEQYEKLLDLCRRECIKVEENDRVIEELSVKENCYGIGVFRKFHNEASGDRHIVLYRFTDHGELGTIMRSAVSFDFKDIILVDTEIDHFDPRVIRASMGSIFHLNIQNYPDLDTYFRDYSDHELYPFTSIGKHELQTLELKKPYSIIIPQVYDGLDHEFKEGCYVRHRGEGPISLSSLSSIVFNHAYVKNGGGRNSGHRARD